MATRGALFAVRSQRRPVDARRSAITLVELAALAVVTGLLAALGYSTYRTYEVRGEVAEGVALGSELIPAVAEYFRRHGEVPTEQDLGRAHTPAVWSPMIASVSVVDGRIDVVFGPGAAPAIANRRISLTPYETAARHVVWICGNRAPGPGLEPLGFAAGGRTAAPLATTIEPRYLSQSCR